MKRTTIWLDDADYEAIRVIQKRWGVRGMSDAIRLALRTYAFSLKDIEENFTVRNKPKAK